MATLEITDDLFRESQLTLDLERDLEGLLPLTDRRLTALRSADPPSWIKIFADVAEWVTPFKVIATVFLSQLAKNAADDLWKNKAAIAAALRNASATPLRKLTAALLRAKAQARPSTDVVVGLPIPDEYFGTALLVPTSSIEDAAVTLAVFVSRVEEIDAAIREANAEGNGPAASVRIVIRPDGSVTLRWQHHKTLEVVERELGGRLTSACSSP